MHYVLIGVTLFISFTKADFKYSIIIILGYEWRILLSELSVTEFNQNSDCLPNVYFKLEGS